MGQKEKLIQRLKSRPKDFTFQEAETLLGYLDYKRSNKGKTSGSRVVFESTEHANILLHKPHPNNELKNYQIKQLITFLEEDKIFYGKVLGIRSLISYEGENATELIDDFHQAVDDYLELCKKSGQTPETAFKGSFNVRISPELHKKVFVYAMAHQISMNRYIEETLAKSPAALEEV